MSDDLRLLLAQVEAGERGQDDVVISLGRGEPMGSAQHLERAGMRLARYERAAHAEHGARPAHRLAKAMDRHDRILVTALVARAGEDC